MIEKKKPHSFIEQLDKGNPFCEITITRTILESQLCYKQTLPPNSVGRVAMNF